MAEFGNKRGSWPQAAFDCWLIAAEASVVVPLRVARIARGGAEGREEMHRMVSEKVTAQVVLAGALATGSFGSKAGEIASGVAGYYLHHVRSNRRRLTGRND